MSISKDLFLAILSMDAYNREYGAGIAISGTSLGNATVKDHEQSGVSPGEYTNWQAAGFYGIAYEIEAGEQIDGLSAGETVISYRGTNGDSWENFWDDAWNGYGVGGGSPAGKQAFLAAEFYQAVTGTSESDPSTGNVTLTGHSLGGGLAGFVAARFGKRSAAR